MGADTGEAGWIRPEGIGGVTAAGSGWVAVMDEKVDIGKELPYYLKRKKITCIMSTSKAVDSMVSLQNVAQSEACIHENASTHVPPIGYNGIDARGWLILSQVRPTDAIQQEDGVMEECWYILKALLASSESTSPGIAAAVLQSGLLQQQCPRWRGLAKVWVAQQSLQVDYVEAIKKELILPTEFYTCFSVPSAPK